MTSLDPDGRGPTTESLEVLLQRAREGDEAALASLIERYRARLLGRIRLMMGPAARTRADSEDFAQGVFLQLVRHIDRIELRGRDAILRWATEVARNRLRNAVRDQREHAFDQFTTMCGADSGTSPTAALRRAEAQHLVAEALESLDEDSRIAIELRDFEGLSFRKIGERMDRTENAAQLLHSRARLRLGRALKRSWGEQETGG